MAEVHYGVIQQGGSWRIVGQNLRFGSYSVRSSAVRAARRLAAQSVPEGILHIQDETGELLPPERVGRDD